MEYWLRRGDIRETRRHAAALAAYTRDEPLAWSDLVIDRARFLADRGPHEHAQLHSLYALAAASRAWGQAGLGDPSRPGGVRAGRVKPRPFKSEVEEPLARRQRFRRQGGKIAGKNRA